jgi:hypothetical protein
MVDPAHERCPCGQHLEGVAPDLVARHGPQVAKAMKCESAAPRASPSWSSPPRSRPGPAPTRARGQTRRRSAAQAARPPRPRSRRRAHRQDPAGASSPGPARRVHAGDGGVEIVVGSSQTPGGSVATGGAGDRGGLVADGGLDAGGWRSWWARRRRRAARWRRGRSWRSWCARRRRRVARWRRWLGDASVGQDGGETRAEANEAARTRGVLGSVVSQRSTSRSRISDQVPTRTPCGPFFAAITATASGASQHDSRSNVDVRITPSSGQTSAKIQGTRRWPATLDSAGPSAAASLASSAWRSSGLERPRRERPVQPDVENDSEARDQVPDPQLPARRSRAVACRSSETSRWGSPGGRCVRGRRTGPRLGPSPAPST